MKPLVLVVDDDLGVRMILERLLGAEGLEVVTAESGIRALALLERRPPDLVLLDVVMPGLDGFAVCAQIKNNPATRLIPVVLVTGLGNSDDRVRGIEVGADDFLSKPYVVAELIARVRSLLRTKSFTDQLERIESVVTTLALSIEARDPYTHGHCERLSCMGAALGARLGLSDREIEALRMAGALHDIGKVAIPDAILLKRGPLTPEERLIIQEHPVRGFEICHPIKSFGLVLPIIRHHHERLDGSGYPDGLVGDAIPRTAQVLQVVDVFDALTSDRPYRQAVTPAEALAMIDTEVARGWWNPAIVQEFAAMVATGTVPAMQAA
jgi:putative two-component system response regulator